jgi:hypothetical protein
MKRALILAFAFAAVGCGGDDGGTGTGTGTGSGNHPVNSSHSCTYSQNDSQVCESFGSDVLAANAQRECEVSNGTFSNGPCSQSNFVASCDLTVGAYGYTLYWYPPATTMEAQSFCTAGNGTFHSGPAATTGTGTGTGSSCIGDSGQSIADGANETRTRYLTATPATGVACEPETQTRTCSNGSWGTWSGSFTAVSCTPSTHQASCTGTVTSCSSLPSNNCFSVDGCSHQLASCVADSGITVYSCSTLFTNQFNCDASLGCSWLSSINTCSGVISVDSLTQSQCTRLDIDGVPTTYQPDMCIGTAWPCSTWSSETVCSEQPGCSWQ